MASCPASSIAALDDQVGQFLSDLHELGFERLADLFFGTDSPSIQFLNEEQQLVHLLQDLAERQGFIAGSHQYTIRPQKRHSRAGSARATAPPNNAADVRRCGQGPGASVRGPDSSPKFRESAVSTARLYSA